MKLFHRIVMGLGMLAGFFIGATLAILKVPAWAFASISVAVVLIALGSLSACELDESDSPIKTDDDSHVKYPDAAYSFDIKSPTPPIQRRDDK